MTMTSESSLQILDLDDMAETVEETLKTTEDLTKRLGETE